MLYIDILGVAAPHLGSLLVLFFALRVPLRTFDLAVGAPELRELKLLLEEASPE